MGAARQWLVNHWDDSKLEMEAFDGTLGRFLAKKITTELSDHHGYPEALEFSLSLPGFEDRLAAAGSLVGIDTWHEVATHGPEDWPRLLTALQAIQEEPLREPLLEYFWKGWGYENLTGATEAVRSLDMFERIQAETILWTIPGVRGTSVDAGMGVTKIATEKMDDQLSNLERVLAEAEVSGADRKLMEIAIGERLIASSSMGKTTVEWIEKHWPQSDADRYFLEQTQREMGRTQFSKALSHADRIYDPELRWAVISGVIRKYGAASPPGVAQYLDSRNDWDPALVQRLKTMLTR